MRAASIGSPLTNANAEGPLSISSGIGTPASRAAILVRVFFTTEYLVVLPSVRRSAFIEVTDNPRYSVTRVACEVRKSSANSLTADAFSGFAIYCSSNSSTFT